VPHVQAEEKQSAARCGGPRGGLRPLYLVQLPLTPPSGSPSPATAWCQSACGRSPMASGCNRCTGSVRCGGSAKGPQGSLARLWSVFPMSPVWSPSGRPLGAPVRPIAVSDQPAL